MAAVAALYRKCDSMGKSRAKPSTLVNGPARKVRRVKCLYLLQKNRMFETVDSSGALTPALRYFLHLAVVWPSIMLASVPFSALLSSLGLNGGQRGYRHFAGYQGIVCLFIGIAAGWIIGRSAPAFVPIGRWIWVLPAVVVVPDMVREVLNSRPVPWLPGEFFSTGENLGVILFMLPTVSALGYSFGMALVGTKPALAKLTSRSPMPHVATITAAWVALFCVLVSLAHSFEHSRIERWSRVRTVIDRPGLSLSGSANDLCATGTSTRGILLPSGTMVEALESRNCFTPEPSGSWTIERVKVLTGSNGGAEGWVLAYGLLEER